MKRKKLISVAVLMILLFNLSNGVFAAGDSGTARPRIANHPSYEREYPIVNLCAGDSGTARPD
jgi:hypothetical protein